MDTLIIIRPELFSIMIMAILIIYDRYCSKFRRTNKLFFKFALADLSHCVMALLTEITVNSDTVSESVNDICHIFFFFFSLLCSIFYLEYAVSLTISNRKIKKKLLIVGYTISFVAIVIMLFSPIEYRSGANTRYSAGLGPTLCYTLGFMCFVIADIIIIARRKIIDKIVIVCIIPLSLATLGLLIVQIIVPEFLYSAQALTLTAVGLFFAIENPVGKIKNQAFIDSNYHIWNRNCYDYDLEHNLAKKLSDGAVLTYVIGDINGLKAVNDKLGHLEGDKLIERTTAVLQEKLKSSYKIYKIGGDEFAAVYFDKSTETIKAEIAEAVSGCSLLQSKQDIPVGISIGYAQQQDGENINIVFKKAEEMMYEEKKMYYTRSGIDRRKV